MRSPTGYLDDLESLLHEPVNEADLAAFLIDRSNLPGPRANLELLGLLVNLSTGRADLIPMFQRWLELKTGPADPTEYLSSVAAAALGAVSIGSDSPARSTVRKLLREAANDSRWRVREGVAMGLQRIGEADFKTLAHILADWSTDATFLEHRAIVAALAHPPILKNHDAAIAALRIAEPIAFSIVGVDPDLRKSDNFKTLKQGLSFALSVLVAHCPEPGFELLSQLVHTRDRDVLAIVRENLKKNRLWKPFPAEVAALQHSIDSLSRR